MRKIFVLLLLAFVANARTLQYNTEFENLEDGDTLDYDLHLHYPLDSIKAAFNGGFSNSNIADTAKIRQSKIDSVNYAVADWIWAYTRKWQQWNTGTWYARFGRGAYIYINDTTANDGDFRVYVDSTKLVFLANDDSTWARHLTADTLHADSLHVGSMGIACDGAITGTTLNTGQGANELYDMDQNVLTTSDVIFDSLAVRVITTSGATSDITLDSLAVRTVIMSGATTVDSLNSAKGINATTVNTGQGNYELYYMNQNVGTTDDVTFDSCHFTGNVTFSSIISQLAAYRYKLGGSTLTLDANDSIHVSYTTFPMIYVNAAASATRDTLEKIGAADPQVYQIFIQPSGSDTIVVSDGNNLHLTGEHVLKGQYDNLTLIQTSSGQWAETSKSINE